MAFEALLQSIAAGATPWKIAVRVASSSNITLSALQTIDGVALAEGDRVLVAGQTNGAENGIYEAASGAWARASDMASSTYLKLGTTIRAMQGTANSGVWTLTSPTNGSIVVGVTVLVLSLAQTGIEVVGDTLNSSAFSSLLSALSTAGAIVDSTSNVLGAVGAKSWFTASAGINVAAAAAVPTWRDRVSGLVMSEATNRPLYRTAEINGYPAVDFDGTNDKLTSATISTDYVANGADFSIVAVVKIDAVTAVVGNNAADCVFADSNNAVGMFLWNNAGTYTLLACAYDGSYRYANKSIGTVLPAQGVVLEMRLVGTDLIASVDGVDGTAYAGFGTLSALVANFHMGYKGAGGLLNGKIAECATFSVGTKQTAVINAFMSKYVP